jgi:hypothetical protein
MGRKAIFIFEPFKPLGDLTFELAIACTLALVISISKCWKCSIGATVHAHPYHEFRSAFVECAAWNIEGGQIRPAALPLGMYVPQERFQR